MVEEEAHLHDEVFPDPITPLSSRDLFLPDVVVPVVPAAASHGRRSGEGQATRIVTSSGKFGFFSWKTK